jgi:hypothetical protein
MKLMIGLFLFIGAFSLWNNIPIESMLTMMGIFAFFAIIGVLTGGFGKELLDVNDKGKDKNEQ